MVSGTVEHYNPGFNGGKPGGRARLSDGSKLDQIPADAKPVETIGGKIGAIAGDEVEKNTIRQAEEEQPQLLHEYLAKPSSYAKDGTLMIATDSAKELFKPFRENPTDNDRSVAAAASRINKVVLKNVLAQPPKPGKEVVQITTASPGSGKTATNTGGTESNVGLKVESIMDDYKAAAKLLNQIIDSGRRPLVEWIYVDDIGKTVERMFHRAIGTDEKPGIGRTVQLNYMLEAYTAIPEVLERLQKDFAGKADFQVIDNSGPKGTATLSTDLRPYIDDVKSQPYTEKRAARDGKVQELDSQGLFQSDRGQRSLKAAQTTDRPDAQNPREAGSGSGASGARGSGNGSGSEQAVPGRSELRSSVLDHPEPEPPKTETKAEPEVSPHEAEGKAFAREIEPARKRSLRENAAGSKPQVIETPAGRAAMFDADSYALWFRSGIGSALADPGQKPTAWMGVHLNKPLANKVILLLRGEAGEARSRPNGSEAAAGFDRLVKSLQDGRDADGGLTILRADYQPHTVREEWWHRFQQEHALEDSDAIRAIAQRPEFKQAADRLRELGYGLKSGYRGRAELALEMMAKAMGGDPALDVTPEERADLVKQFATALAEEHGPGILENLPAAHPDAQRAIDNVRGEVRRNYGSPNEGRRGQAERGADAGAGKEGAGGGQGRSDLPGRRGEPAGGRDERGGEGGAQKEGELNHPTDEDLSAGTPTAQFQRRLPGEVPLPGFENADKEAAAAVAEQQGEDLSKEMRQPLPSISKRTGEMERKSPLFRDSEANPERDLFGSGPESQGALFQRVAPKAGPRDADEHYQWMKNEQGAQKFGNQQTIKKLTPELFEQWIKPLLRPGYAETLKDYLEKHPDDTHISLVKRADGKTILGAPAQGPLESLRPRQAVIEKGWAKRVDSFDSAEAREHGATADEPVFQAATAEGPVARSVQDLIDDIAAMPRPAKGTRLDQAAEWMGRKSEETLDRTAKTWSGAPSKVEKALANTKLVFASLANDFVKPPEETDFKAEVGQMQLARAETDLKLRALAKEIKDTVPDRQTRIAMTHWREANGDPEKLKRWATKAAQRWETRDDGKLDSRLKEAWRDAVGHYEAATKLTPEQKALAQRIGEHLDEMLRTAKDEGLLEMGARNYIRHLFEKTPESENLLHLVDNSELDPNPSFIQHRVFQNYFDAETAGMVPKNKDIGFLLTAYDKSFSEALASRAMLKGMLDGKARDGRPLAAIKMRGKWVMVDDQHLPQVMEQRERPQSLKGYREFDLPQTRNFLFEPTKADLEGFEYDPRLFAEDPKKLAFQGDLIFHPEIADTIEDMLRPGWFERNQNWPQRAGGALMRGSALAKETMTALAPFHMVQEGIHSLEHGVNPFKLPELDFSGEGENSRKQRLLASNGLALTNFDAEGLFSARALKGLAEGVPGVNVAMDALNSFSRWQFESYIPRLKMSMALKAFNRNAKRYPELSERQVAELTAKESNAAFGNLNTYFDNVHRSKTFKQLLRLAMFAPDFLEARMRFVGQAFTRYGGEQRAALLKGALVMYAIARIVNALLNHGDAKWDPEHAFSIVSNGRQLSLRTVQGDLLHAVTDPRGFIYNRMNPLTTRPVVEFLSGRDQFGRQKSGAHQLRDISKSVLPFGVQKVIQQGDEGWLDSLLTSTGFSTSNYRSPAEEETHKLYLQGIPDLPDDEEREAASRKFRQLEEQLREHKIKPKDVWDRQHAGEMTPRQAARTIERTQHSPLYNEYKSGAIKLGDAMNIFEKATAVEKMELRPALATKGADQLPEMPEGQRAEMAKRWHKLLDSTPSEDAGEPEVPAGEAVAAK